MATQYPTSINVQLATILGLLEKIDRLHLSASLHQELETTLVRQITLELNRAIPWHQGHSRRTTNLAQRMGKRLGLSVGDLHHLKLASLLHDIGLLTLPTHLFFSCLNLDTEAYTAVQCHPRIGAELLEMFHFLREAAVIVAHHHERWDGTGYPYGLRSRFIPFGARILSVADAFDSIEVPGAHNGSTRDRVARRIIRTAAGTQFDPAVVDALEHVLMSQDWTNRELQGGERD